MAVVVCGEGLGKGVCFEDKKRRRKRKELFGVVVSEEVAVRVGLGYLNTESERNLHIVRF